MMKLYYAPGACSLASHIILHEVGKPFTTERVDLATKTTENGVAFASISPKSQVPALYLPSGHVLTEGAAVLQFIADSAGATDLAPPTGTLARARVQEILNFTASELHKAFGPLFSTNVSQAAKDAAPAAVGKCLDVLESVLSDGRDYLTGPQFTVADAYAFVVVGWARPTGIGLARWPKLQAFLARIEARSSVQAAMAAEGLAA
ncbi:MAG: glutathione transferase GstA [Elstera sp.]